MIPSLVPLILATPAWSVTRLISKALFGLVTDWTNPSDVIYATQPTLTGFSGAGWSGSGMGPYLHATGNSVALEHANALIVGNRYVITYEITGCTAGLLTAFAGTATGIDRSADGTYTDSVTCAGNTTLSFAPSNDFDGIVTIVSVENLSVTEALIKKGKGAWAGTKFVQPSAANMPYWDNGLNFDGVNDFMQHSGPPEKLHTPDGFTAAFVIEPEITVATGNRVILDQTNNDPTNPGLQVVYNAANQQLMTRVSNGSEWTVSGSTWLSRGIPHIVDARWDEASGLDLVVDDHSVEVVGGSGSLADTVALQLGRRQGGDYFSGRLSDMVVREGRVPEKDIERWRGKMRGKWAEKLVGNAAWAIYGDYAQFYFKVKTGVAFSVNWGDEIVQYTGTGTATWQLLGHNYTSFGRYVTRIIIEDLSDLLGFSSELLPYCGELLRSDSIVDYRSNINRLTGEIPSLSNNPSLVTFNCGSNQLTGEIPSLSNNPSLVNFNCYINQLTGEIPSLSNNPSLVTFNCGINQLTGEIPSLSNNPSLVNFNCNANQLTGYTPSTISTKCTNFQAQNNLLPQTSIDQIISDFHTNLSNRPVTGTLNLGGTGNAAPSAAGKAKAKEIREHGWTVTVVGGLG